MNLLRFDAGKQVELVMSHYRNSPLRIFIDGEPVQLKPAGGDRFRSKKFEYQIEYDSSGKLVGKVVRPLNQAEADSSSEPIS